MSYHFLWINKDQWELIYYIAFVILTFGLAFFAARTFYFQTKKSSKLYCKCVMLPPDGRERNMYLEIYNYGNDIAKNIKVQIENTDLGNIPFLRPNESYMIFFASFGLMMSGDFKKLDSKIPIDNKLVRVYIDINGTKQTHEIDISFFMTSVNPAETGAEHIANAISKLESKIGRR